MKGDRPMLMLGESVHPLFGGMSLADRLREFERLMLSAAAQAAFDELRDREELVERFRRCYTFRPLELLGLRSTSVVATAEHGTGRPTTTVQLRLMYAGSREMWNLLPRICASVHPRGVVHDDELWISRSWPSAPSVDEVRAWRSAVIEELAKWIALSCREIDEVNASFDARCQAALDARSSALAYAAGLERELNSAQELGIDNLPL